MKKRTRRGDPQRQRYWEGVVQRWKEGDQSVAAFCRAEGLRESAFYCWRRKLAMGGRRTGERASEARKGTPAFRRRDRVLGHRFCPCMWWNTARQGQPTRWRSS